MTPIDWVLIFTLVVNPVGSGIAVVVSKSKECNKDGLRAELTWTDVRCDDDD